jgi:hypothetical protein
MDIYSVKEKPCNTHLQNLNRSHHQIASRNHLNSVDKQKK